MMRQIGKQILTIAALAALSSVAGVVLPAAAASLVTDIVTDPLTGVAIDGYDPVSYFTETEPQQGKPDFEYDWGGVPWYFATAANRDVFMRAPDIYAPQIWRPLRDEPDPRLSLRRQAAHLSRRRQSGSISSIRPPTATRSCCRQPRPSRRPKPTGQTCRPDLTLRVRLPIVAGGRPIGHPWRADSLNSILEGHRQWPNFIELKATDLAAMLCSRVCHDLINPVGAIGNGLEVLADPTQSAMAEGAQELIANPPPSTPAPSSNSPGWPMAPPRPRAPISTPASASAWRGCCSRSRRPTSTGRCR